MQRFDTAHIAIVVLTLTFAVASWAQAAGSVERPLAGQRIRLVVGFGAGGGYDAYARLLAPHLKRETGATVVVENWPGGGGLVALNKGAADRSDGLTLMLVNGPSATISQILGREGVRYDLRELIWLGRVFAERNVILASPRSPYRSLADVAKADGVIRWASAGKTTGAGVAALVSQALNLDSRIIIGYKGTNESSLAILRGEADLVPMSATSAKQQSYENGLMPIATVGQERSSLLPDVPTVFEQLDLSPEQAWWIEYGAGIMELGRAIATSSHVTAERRDYLRRVIETILTDPDVKREGNARGRPIEFAPASSLEASVNRALGNVDETTREQLKHVILEKFYP